MMKRLAFSALLFAAIFTLIAASTQPNAAFQLQGTLPCANMPAHTGDVTTTAGSCATVIGSGVIVNGDLAAGAYAKSVFRAFCTGTVTSSSTSFGFAGFGSSTTACTGVTTAAGGTKMTSAGTIKNMYVNLSAAGKSGDLVAMLKNGSTTGAPTCTYGTATTCNDVSTALTVAAGDVITLRYTSGSSDGSANLAVSFEFWN